MGFQALQDTAALLPLLLPQHRSQLMRILIPVHQDTPVVLNQPNPPSQRPVLWIHSQVPRDTQDHHPL